MLRFKECVNKHLSIQPGTEALQQAIIDTIQQVTELERTNSFILMAPPVPDKPDYIQAFNKYAHQAHEQKKCHHDELTPTTLNEEQVLYVCKKCGIVLFFK